MDEKSRQYVVFLKDIGTNKVTRHRVKAADRDLAMRSFADRGLHTLGAEDFWFHLLKRLSIFAGLALLLLGAIYLSVEIVQETRFYFF
jgi:hypothetical protein